MKTFRLEYYEYLMLGLIILIGFIFTVYIPPFQKPDEIVHYYRTIALAKGQIFCFNNNTGGRYFEIPNRYYRFPEVFAAENVLHKYQSKVPPDSYKIDYSEFNQLPIAQGNKRIDLCPLPFIGYMPNVVGFLIGQTISNSLLLSFNFSRLGGLVFFLACLIISLFIVPQNYKQYLWVYSFIPMTLHQVTAISYDVVLLSLALLIFSLMIKMLVEKKKNTHYFYIYAFLLWLLLLSKPGYYAFYLLYFVIPYKKIFNDLKQYILFSITVTIIIFSSLTWMTLTLRALNYNTLTTQPPPQLQLIKSDPLFFLAILKNSIITRGEYYLTTLIGYLGWLDYTLNFFVILGCVLLLAYTLYAQSKVENSMLKWWQTSLVIVFLLSSCLIISVSIYAGERVFAQPFLTQIQGRYVLMLLPFLMFLIVQFSLVFTRKQLKIGCFAIFIIFMLTNIVVNIHDRYFDYSLIRSERAESKSIIHRYKSKPSSITHQQVDHAETFLLANDKLNIVNGMQLMIQKQKDGISYYAFKVLDVGCKKELYHGYFSVAQNPDDAAFTVDYTRGIQFDKKVCMIIKPFNSASPQDPILLIKIDNQPAIQFLGY